jgi:hypothetical protein
MNGDEASVNPDEAFEACLERRPLELQASLRSASREGTSLDAGSVKRSITASRTGASALDTRVCHFRVEGWPRSSKGGALPSKVSHFPHLPKALRAAGCHIL